MRERVPHYLRGNRAARAPRRVVTIDSEAWSATLGREQTQRFRLACARFDLLEPDATPAGEPLHADFDHPAELWRWVDERTSGLHVTRVFAHNLAYDLRITGALHELEALGWTYRQPVLNEYGCWVYLRRGDRSLYLLDSLSHLPCSLKQLAGRIGRRQAPLPPPGAPDDLWRRRCCKDCAILREALLRYLRLLVEHDCGDFRVSGGAQATACFRHRFLEPRSLLVHADGRALAAERRAAWTGRAEIWRHGHYRRPLFEYDLPAAYATIGAELELPIRLVGESLPRTRAGVERLRERYALLVECDVETGVPAVPAALGERVCWPVGRFTTTLWDVELDLLEEEGGAYQHRRVWAYKRGPLLRSWAEWILAALAGETMGRTPLGRLVVKEWSRALIGRFGLRYSRLVEEGENPWSEFVLRPVRDVEAGESYLELQLGRRVWRQLEREEAPSSTPAVMGYVMAACRVRLWEAMRAAGLEHVYSVDTDGLIVDEQGAERLEAAPTGSLAGGPVRKAAYRSATLRAPRNLELGDLRRVSGVPRNAEQIAEGVYRGEVWESLPAALRRRRTSSLVVSERTFTVGDLDPRRLHLPDGSTAALELPLES